MKNNMDRHTGQSQWIQDSLYINYVIKQFKSDKDIPNSYKNVFHLFDTCYNTLCLLLINYNLLYLKLEIDKYITTNTHSGTNLKQS